MVCCDDGEVDDMKSTTINSSVTEVSTVDKVANVEKCTEGKEGNQA